MFRTFNYIEQDDNFNNVVEATLDLARANADAGKNPLPSDYSEKVKALNYNIVKEIVKGTKFEEKFAELGTAVLKNPNVRKNKEVQENFNAILAQVTTAILPEVTNNLFSRFISEVHQVGWGETARFTVESNDLMKVNRKAEGVRKGVDQPIYNDEFTVNAEPLTLD